MIMQKTFQIIARYSDAAVCLPGEVTGYSFTLQAANTYEARKLAEQRFTKALRPTEIETIRLCPIQH